MHPQLEKELALVQRVYGQTALETRYIHELYMYSSATLQAHNPPARVLCMSSVCPARVLRAWSFWYANMMQVYILSNLSLQNLLITASIHVECFF